MMREQIEAALRDVDARTLILGAGALAFIGLVAAVLYAVMPVYSEYAGAKLRHERALTSYTIADGADSAVAIANLEGDVLELHRELFGGAAGVPRAQIESFVVNSLDRISGRHGVELLGITPDEPSSIWMFEELPYRVEVEGSYLAIHEWLYEVEEELRPMVVKEFELMPSRSNEGVVIDLRLVAYRASGKVDA